MPRLLLAGVALATLVVGGANAQFTSHDLRKISGREYVRLVDDFGKVFQGNVPGGIELAAVGHVEENAVG